VVDILCRYVHSECDEGVEQNKLKPEDYVCLACKNRDTLPVCPFLSVLALAVGCVCSCWKWLVFNGTNVLSVLMQNFPVVCIRTFFSIALNFCDVLCLCFSSLKPVAWPTACPVSRMKVACRILKTSAFSRGWMVCVSVIVSVVHGVTSAKLCSQFTIQFCSDGLFVRSINSTCLFSLHDFFRQSPRP